MGRAAGRAAVWYGAQCSAAALLQLPPARGHARRLRGCKSKAPCSAPDHSLLHFLLSGRGWRSLKSHKSQLAGMCAAFVAAAKACTGAEC